MTYYDVFADQLACLKHGHALWEPDMRGQPLRLGDVGFFESGSFYRLFNVHLPDGHPSQSRQLPEHFQPLPSDNVPHVDHGRRFISEGARYSKSVRVIESNAQISSRYAI